MTTPANTAQIPDGSPLATPFFLVDASGKPITSSNPLNIGLAVDTLDAQVTNDGTFAKETGGNLATLAGAVSASKYQVNVANANTNGQNTMANSSPVVLASDEVVPIRRNCVAVFTQASGATSGSTQNSGDLAVGVYTELSIDINTTAQSGTSPTIQYFYERKGADGLYYVLWQSAVLTLAANTLSTSIGPGLAYTQSLGLTGRLRWVIGGSATPTYTHSLNVYAK